MEKLYKLMSELKRKRKYFTIPVWFPASDGVYILEKLGREPTSTEIREVFLKELSKK